LWPTLIEECSNGVTSMTIPQDPKYERVVKAFEFLRARAVDQVPFTVQDVMSATGWTESSVKTYISKQWRDVLASNGGGYRVKPEFRRIGEADFKRLISQKRKIYSQYRRVEYGRVVTYEFLLPLTRENELRASLDDLFYTDTVKRRILEIGLPEVSKWVPREQDEKEVEYLDRLSSTLAEKFGGYSILHVHGRFRACSIKSRQEAAEMILDDERYLIDETTAVVRFVIPVEVTKNIDSGLAGGFTFVDSASASDIDAEVDRIRTFFFNLFAEAIVRTVQGEDEIWLLEDTGSSRRLYVWERSSI